MYILAIINASVWVLLITLIIPMVILYPASLYKMVNNKKFLNKFKKGRLTESL